MAIGSGLAASISIGREVTFGTPVTTSRALEFVSESLTHERVTTESSSIRAGRQVGAAGRRRISNVTAGGDIELEFGTRAHNVLLEALMGSQIAPNGTLSLAAPVAVTGAAGAYRTTWNLGELNTSYTLQKIVPRTDGVLQAITFAGAKCTGAEFSLSVGELLTATFSWDAVQGLLPDGTTTALNASAAAYVDDVAGYTFRDGSLLVKPAGAADTAFTPAAAIREVTISVENPLATERFFLNGGGTKATQIQNGLRTIGGSLGAEFFDNTLLTNYMGDVEFGLRLRLEGRTIGATTQKEQLTFTMPSVFLDGSLPTVGGTDLVEFGGDFTALAPGTGGASALTIEVVNADAAVI